jgi:hypothetical protein
MIRRLWLAVLATLALMLATAGAAYAQGIINVPQPISFANGTAIFYSGNGATGTSCAFMPVPSRTQLFASAYNTSEGRRFGFRNDCARSLRLINVTAPLTIKISDDTFECDDGVHLGAKPKARIFIRKSGTYTIGSFEGSSSQGPFLRFFLVNGGASFAPAVSVIRSGIGQLDGKVSCIQISARDDGNDQAKYPGTVIG